MKFCSLLIIVSLSLLLNCREKNNKVYEYFNNAELHYESEPQKAEILKALNDILQQPPEVLKNKRYTDYRGKKDQWNLPEIISRYFVPDQQSKNLGADFYTEVKAEAVQRQIRSIITKSDADQN